MEAIVYLVTFVIFISLGFTFGRAAERRHFAQLRRREAACQNIVTTQVKHFMAPASEGKTPRLLVAETVVASDYLKTFLARFRNIFGGEVRSFQTLLERGRREVTVQLQEQAAAAGYNALCNVRLNTAHVGGSYANAAAMASIIGWATAYDMSPHVVTPTDAPRSAGADDQLA